MDINKVKAVFALFSGEEYSERWDSVVELAVSEVEKRLRPETDPDDPRLPFLAAAAANYNCQMMLCAADKSRSAYAGKMTEADQGRSLRFAKRILKEYGDLCRDILVGEELLFMGFSGKELRHE